ncbi:glutathione S-transferase [Alteromonas aestuariivivens]|uniref:Glutathione S-transferase n=1 Tax=Alteromonas aestuariivivens TaxID=1938339 RepID=A0A3D8M4Z6_9ALTE|nr:MAPEG family protein [Alteromonas aestuariivivens]RDV24678.1 glutathione S-transferase [Alteromonas aestuariivivens]
MSFPITAFYASLLALCYIYLSLAVIAVRRRERVSLGDGGHGELRRLLRAHANFNEYVPIGLILLGCLESISELYFIEHLCACLLLFGRMLHAYGLHHHEGTSWQRFVGMLMTFLSIIIMASTNLLVLHFLVV